MNHAVVLNLFRKHGKELNFLGVLLQRTRFETEHGKYVTAACTSQMAKLIGADGVIITRMTPSGNNFVDIMLTLQACERKGVSAVLLGPEWGGRDGNEIPLVFYVPEAKAMVSTGSLEREVGLPSPAKVIGGEDGGSVELASGEPFSPSSEGIPPDFSLLGGGVDWWGAMRRTCKEC
jgi:glycine reductase